MVAVHNCLGHDLCDLDFGRLCCSLHVDPFSAIDRSLCISFRLCELIRHDEMDATGRRHCWRNTTNKQRLLDRCSLKRYLRLRLWRRRIQEILLNFSYTRV